MKIVMGSDHAGYALKLALMKELEKAGHEVTDLGTHSPARVDYPSYCAAVGRAVVRGEAHRGIVLGGSGQGEAMAANKVRGVRAALCWDEHTARLARRHNDANVLSLGGRILAESFAWSITDVFLSSPFDGGRHERRIRQIAAIEEEECKR